jgi:carbon storage regulator
MLVLSRKVEESIYVGDSKITVLRFKHGGKVSIGIEAPPEVPIRRGELVSCAEDPLPTSPGVPGEETRGQEKTQAPERACA